MKKLFCVEIGGIAISFSSSLAIKDPASKNYLNFLCLKKPRVSLCIRPKDNRDYFAGRIVFQVKKRYDILDTNDSLRFIAYPDKCRNANAHVLELSKDLKQANVFLPRLKDYTDRVAFDYPLDQLLMMSLLSRMDGVLLHASGIIHNGNAILFPGLSGAGKTTISRLLHKNGFIVLSDDRIIIRRLGKNIVGFGTPWPGAGKFALPEAAPVKKILFLTHGRKNRINALNRVEALQRLVTCAFIPFWDHGATENALDIFVRLTDSIDCLELSFLPDDSVVSFLKKLPL